MPHRFFLPCLVFLSLAPLHAQAQQPSAPLPDISGLYGQHMVTTARSSIPVFGDVFTSTHTYSLVQIKQTKAGGLSMTEKVCDIRVVSSNKKIKTIIPKGFQRAVSGQSRSGYLKRNTSGSVKMVFPSKVTIFGAKLARPRKDALPDDEDDKRLVDADKDGKPGLTIKVRGLIDGELYIVTRGWNSLTATLPKALSSIKGSVKWANNQSVVDATSIFLKAQLTTTADKRPSKNTFAWSKLAAGSTCALVK